jgi:trimeric autotransporter adhesin
MGKLVAYSGFSSSNYLEQPYNSDLDFGTGDFSVMAWIKTPDTGSSNYTIMRRQGDTGLGAWRFRAKGALASLWLSDDGVSSIDEILSTSTIDDNTWKFVCAVRLGNAMYMYVNGKYENTSVLSNATGSLSSSDATLCIGVNQDNSEAWLGSIALARISATAPTAEQIAKIYEDEKVLFQEGAQATLYGSSDAVTALAYDDTTELLHVGTSAGRSTFSGLKRVDNTTTGVTAAISASNEMVVEQ